MPEKKTNSSDQVDESWWTFSRLILMHQFVFPKLARLGHKYRIEIIEELNPQDNGAEVRITGNIPSLWQIYKEEIGAMCTFRRTKQQYEDWVNKQNLSCYS